MWFYILAGYCAFVLFLFPIITLVFIGKTKKVNDSATQDRGVADLKASILYLQMAFPTILFLLGALGFTSYKVVIDTVTENVTQAVTDTVTTNMNKTLNKQKITEWTNEIEALHEKAEIDYAFIDSLAAASEDTIGRIAVRSFLNYLPKGTIIPYRGSRNDVDFNYWAICDGTKGTPDLRSRFILGGSFQYMGQKGGTNSHSHSGTTVAKGTVLKKDALKWPHKDGTGRDFDLETHNHAFTGARSSVNISSTKFLPPYYRLVFLMKIN